MHDRLKPLTLVATLGVLATFIPNSVLMAQDARTLEPGDTEQITDQNAAEAPESTDETTEGTDTAPEQAQAQPQPPQQEQPPLGPVRPEVLQQMQLQKLQQLLPILQQRGQIQPPQQQPRQTGPSSIAAPRRGSISFNFDDADVYSVIQTIFGDILKVNYIVDPKVKGRVTFRTVSPVAKDDVLPLMEVVLRLNGVGIVEDSGLYRIISISDIAKEPAKVSIGREAQQVKVTGKALLQIVPMKYVKSTDMVKMLTPFASTNALIVDVPNSNNLIIVDTDSNVKRLLQIVEIFDSERMKQTRPQVHVYPVQNGKAKDVASLLQQIFLGASSSSSSSGSQTSPVPGQSAIPAQAQAQAQVTTAAIGGTTNLVSEITRIFPDEVTNSVIILAAPEDYELIAETIKQIDIVPRQVMIEAVVAQVKLEDKLNLGIAWTLQTDFNMQLFKNDFNIKGPLVLNPTGYKTNTDGSISANPPLPDTSFTFTAFDRGGKAKFLIQTLAANGKANVLSAPHILVSDNKEAKIQVGDQIPIATSVTTPTVATTTDTANSSLLQTSSIQYKDTGTILKVKPQVNDSGLVALELTQEVSSPNLTTVLGSSQYTISKSEVTSNLVVQDGETIVIGGLINEKVDKSRRGIPLLMDIPFIGHLFGHTINETTKTELVILLTPHVIKNQQEAAEVSSGYLQRLKGLREQFKKDEVYGGTFSQGEQSDSKPLATPYTGDRKE